MKDRILYNSSMHRMSGILRSWLPIATTVVMLSGLVYLAVQQSYRQGANDPQIQIAQDLKETLQNGKSAQDLVGQTITLATQVDLRKSLASFVIIFDDNGKPIASQAVLDGRIPTPPPGVFSYTKTKKEDRFSWEPKPGVREATVLLRFEGSKPGFVLVGRSLKEVENRVSQLGQRMAVALGAILLLSLILAIILT